MPSRARGLPRAMGLQGNTMLAGGTPVSAPPVHSHRPHSPSPHSHTTPTSGCHMTLAGSPVSLKMHPVQCTANNQKHNVRCCSNDDTNLPMSTYGCSKRPCAACANKTFAQADALCSGKSLRLCTQDEIVTGLASGTGCSFDAKRIWSSTTARGTNSTPSLPPPPPPTTGGWNATATPRPRARAHA